MERFSVAYHDGHVKGTKQTASDSRTSKYLRNGRAEFSRQFAACPQTTLIFDSNSVRCPPTHLCRPLQRSNRLVRGLPPTSTRSTLSSSRSLSYRRRFRAFEIPLRQSSRSSRPSVDFLPRYLGTSSRSVPLLEIRPGANCAHCHSFASCGEMSRYTRRKPGRSSAFNLEVETAILGALRLRLRFNTGSTGVGRARKVLRYICSSRTPASEADS